MVTWKHPDNECSKANEVTEEPCCTYGINCLECGCPYEIVEGTAYGIATVEEADEFAKPDEENEDEGGDK